MRSNKTLLKQYFTPKILANILVENTEDLITPKNIVDLSVGAGELLYASYNKWENANLFGVDIDGTVIKQLKDDSRNRFILNNADGLKINYRASFKKFFEVLESGGFDLCIANPPFDRFYKLNIAGKTIVIPLEILFLEQYLNICKIGGIIAIILPNGFLTSSSNKEFREWMLSKVIIRRVISVPIEAFPEVSAKTEILILERINEYKSRIIEFKKYDKDFNLIDRLKLRVKKKQLISRMDFDFYKPRIKFEQTINQKNIHLKQLKNIILDHGRGFTVYGEQRLFVKSGIRYIHSTNIGDIGIDFLKEELFVDKDSAMYRPRAHTKVNDILMIRVGNNAGKTALVCSENEVGVASDCLYIFRLKEDINPYYFTALMKTDFMKTVLKRLKHGSCSSVISKNDLLEVEIPILKKDVQDYFGLELKRIYLSSLNNEDSKINLIAQKKLVRKIDDYIRGEYDE
ncbi:type I restriction-modification system methyltransferase subunit [Schinkia azotoformans MEV2011]|uniref:Type I restriction-modification system methyltransferase subunit n=3 Tax=Schinkia azotoformans TaxID=1454 RepID=A0A072NN42_SCHAZ|nr:N-6 DNA methylase [Schinkia azotoformans]KEF38652.1 type I restriction-modification system methyltransferase subunit [Schinkia azotoformans MEV2011]MEC1698150.1 N-6 DNA methylase [Schinkia azotoformans]MEC1714797.1 N-6 DNA methylase [Schinkia azotoformans]MEC1727098.1 N-6 DNA methylase [Schinkia azotoformans]MEC1742289.1 N-6 DNA methylase [Schinkia azotoformans]